MLSIRWRPSGGRGEYEYITKAQVLGKLISIEVPGLGAVMPTDVRFRIKDGKPRLRRDNPSDRSVLNVPPLVAAIAGLPEPRREDKGVGVQYPLDDKSYVIDELLCEIVSEEPEAITLKPVLFKPRNSTDYIDVEARIDQLLDAVTSNDRAREWRDTVVTSINNTAILQAAASGVHAELPYYGLSALGTSLPFDPTESSADQADEIIENYVGSEGKVRIRIHRHKERDRKLVRLSKKKFKLVYGSLFCECCGIDFGAMYPILGADFMEAHHRVPLSTLEENNATLIDDLAMLCANCHRMVHRTETCSILEVQQLIAASNSYINRANIEHLNAVRAEAGAA